MRNVGILMTIMFVLIVVSSVPTVAANDSLYIYTIHNYGSLVVATINRSALTYLGDGYWLLILPDMDAVTFSSKLVGEIIDKFIGSRPLYSRIHVVMTNDGYRIVKKFSALNTSEIPSTESVNVVLQALNASRAREASISFLEGNVIRINIVAQNKLDVEKLTKKLLGIAKNHRIVVIETLGFGLPSYFEAQDLYKSLRKVPCFISAGESLYGINIWFDITCIKKLASTINQSFNETLESIISSIKALNPLIRKYLPYQDIVIVVAQPPSPAMPLPLPAKPVEKIERTETIRVPSSESELTSQEVSRMVPDQTLWIFIVPAIIVAAIIVVALWKIRLMK